MKTFNRETGRILFDLNEFAREDCAVGLIECKNKLNIFGEMIEYLDSQAKEARKVVFDKNNQIGRYFNEVQQVKQQNQILSTFYFIRV